MSESISAFDGNYVRLGQVAALLAQERPQCAFEDVMDLLKRSVFAGEFEPPSFEVGETREDPRNWLHMEIEAPRCMLPPDQAALSVRPKQLYGVNRSTITSVLLTTDALPGEWVEWEPLLDMSVPPYTAENGFSALAAIPFRDFPERGRRELEALLIPMEKLVPWLKKRGWTLPAFLARAPPGGKRRTRLPAPSRAAARHRRPRHDERAGRGSELDRALLSLCANSQGSIPIGRRRILAEEAWKRAGKEFDESELPSVTTIERHMVDILGGGSGAAATSLQCDSGWGWCSKFRVCCLTGRFRMQLLRGARY